MTPPAGRDRWRMVLAAALILLWLLVAWRASSDKAARWLAVLPWLALALAPGSATVALRQLWTQWRVPAVAAGLLAAWLLLGAWVDGRAAGHRWVLGLLSMAWIPATAVLVAWAGSNVRAGRWIAAAASVALVMVAWKVWGQMVGEGISRPAGTTHNVLMGSLALATALVGVGWLLHDVSLAAPVRRLWITFLVGAALLLAMLSSARTPLVAAAVTVVILRAAWRWPVRARHLVLAAGVIAAWFALTGNRWQVAIDQTAGYASTTHKTSIGARVDMVRWGATHVLDIPPFGFTDAGLMQRMNQRYLDYGLSKQQVYELIHMHNDFLQLAYAHGLVAALAALVGVVALLLGLRAAANREPHRDTARVVSAAMLLLLMSAQFDCFFYWPAVNAMLQALLAAGVASVMSVPADLAARADAPD